MNFQAVRAIYTFEMARTGRTLMQSIVSPVLSTSLYFVVFGAAIGSRITNIEGVAYGAFIVPGLIMLTLLTQSVMNASFGIYFPRFTGTIYEILAAPISAFEIVLGYVGAAATKSVILGVIILITSFFSCRCGSSTRSGCSPSCPDGDHLQPARLHHRDLGGRFREAADRSAAGHHAADLPRRQLLFDQRAAAGLADDQPVQSGRLPGQRLSLGLLRDGGRRCRDQPCDDAALSWRMPRRDLVDVQDRLSAEELRRRAASAGYCLRRYSTTILT